MKKIMYTVAILTLGYVANAQVGIGTTTPAPSSMLDITSTTQGLLKPRMTTAQRIAIATPAKGLEVFDITTNSPWHFDGTVWVTPSQDLRLVGTSNHITQDAGIGSNGTSVGTGIYNIGIGRDVLSNNTDGGFNTALGDQALVNNTAGYNNSAIGNGALFSNTTGQSNTAIGGSLPNNIDGSRNVAIGMNAMNNNISGENNTSIGTNSGTTIQGNNNIAIGYGANVPLSAGNNQMNIGNAIYGANLDLFDINNLRIGINAPTPNSTLQVNGSFSASIVNVAADYAVLDNDYTILVDTSAGDITLTLPAASADNKGRIYNITNIAYDSNPTAGIIVNNVLDRGQPLGTLNTANAAFAIYNFSVQSDGNNWYVVSIGGL